MHLTVFDLLALASGAGYISPSLGTLRPDFFSFLPRACNFFLGPLSFVSPMLSQNMLASCCRWTRTSFFGM